MTRKIEWRRFFRRFFIPIIVFHTMLFQVSPLCAAGSIRIFVPDAVRVEGSACTIADVAEIDGPRESTERIGALLLSVEGRRLTREQVIEALKVSGLQGVRIELTMPAVVRVEEMNSGALVEPASREQSREALTALIKSLAAWDGGVEVRYQGAVPDGRLTSPASLVPGTSAATLRFRDSSGRERSLAVRLVWTQPALILARSVKKGERLKESDVVIRYIRVNKPDVYASRFSETEGRALKKNLSRGAPIALDLLVGAPIIERGKSVVIVARNAGLTAQAKGEALENGALGETIKVRNVSSKVVLTAVVVARDVVEVKMP